MEIPYFLLCIIMLGVFLFVKNALDTPEQVPIQVKTFICTSSGTQHTHFFQMNETT